MGTWAVRDTETYVLTGSQTVGQHCGHPEDGIAVY